MTAAAKRQLVLVHGWGVNRCIWRPIADALENRYQIIAVDLPGYGGHHPLDGSDSLITMAEDVADSVTGPAVWIGWSLGGMVAMQVAISRPSQVTRLILVGSTAKFVTDRQWQHGVSADDIDRFGHDLSTDYDAALSRFLLLQSARVGNSRQLARQIGALITACGEPDKKALERSLEILISSDLRPLLSRLRVPTDVIHGRYDRLVPPTAARYLVDRIPNARLSWLPGGHAPFVTHPQEFVTLLFRDDA
jgi:pimeloyl-[acyl-carrier protein] methyl ester esterase